MALSCRVLLIWRLPYNWYPITDPHSLSKRELSIMPRSLLDNEWRSVVGKQPIWMSNWVDRQMDDTELILERGRIFPHSRSSNMEFKALRAMQCIAQVCASFNNLVGWPNELTFEYTLRSRVNTAANFVFSTAALEVVVMNALKKVASFKTPRPRRRRRCSFYSSFFGPKT